eukprot:TRINITY_DN16_c3_g1_i7.p3 TRINITY_DN16_c3_g1~~TRINITY_DN16_c3_g1_i7.p3  ORF type:complete len:122 (+),score=1.29 TRINITY_DN16_c3_g1_i7:606-971(+)
MVIIFRYHFGVSECKLGFCIIFNNIFIFNSIDELFYSLRVPIQQIYVQECMEMLLVSLYHKNFYFVGTCSPFEYEFDLFVCIQLQFCTKRETFAESYKKHTYFSYKKVYLWLPRVHIDVAF